MSERSSQRVTEPPPGEAKRPTGEIGDLLQRCYRFAFSLTHEAGRAEDLVQDACLAVVRVNGPWSRPFLFSVIRNRFIDQHRHARLVGMDSLDDAGTELCDPDDRFWNEPLVTSLRGGDLERALGRLKPMEREVLYLSAIEGYTAREIAALWSCPRGTVLSMAHRARHKLRRWLSPQPVESEGDPT